MRPLMIAGCISVLLMPALADANIGPQWWGDRAAEPLGLQDVAITHEKLTFDLRPLAAVQPVVVEAIYHLRNNGSSKKLNLLFITGVSGVSDFEVRLNDRRMQNKQATAEKGSSKLPASWQPPEYLPGLESGSTQGRTHLAASEKIILAFSIELPAGTSILRANYRARATGTDEGYPTVTWQFPYILAPARAWASFGDLDVTVHLPQTWQAVSTPALERKDDVLHGHFTSLPADCLALAARAPIPPELKAVIRRYVILYALAVASGGFLCWWGGRLHGRSLARFFAPLLALERHYFGLLRGFRFCETAIFALVMAVNWAALIMSVLFFALDDTIKLLAGQESPLYREQFFLPIWGTILLLPIVLLAGFCLAWSSSRRQCWNSNSL